MKSLLVAVSVLALLAGSALADQKARAKKALDAREAWQPGGIEVDGPTWIGNGDGRHVRDPLRPHNDFWRDHDLDPVSNIAPPSGDGQ